VQLAPAESSVGPAGVGRCRWPPARESTGTPKAAFLNEARRTRLNRTSCQPWPESIGDWYGSPTRPAFRTDRPSEEVHSYPEKVDVIRVFAVPLAPYTFRQTTSVESVSCP
jgi:hypothetical protein